MLFQSFAYIFLSPGFSEQTNTVDTEKNRFKMRAIGLDLAKKYEVISVAKELVSEGYQMIELCGVFREWISKVSQAIDQKIPVGGVFYGPEYRKIP